MPSLSFTTSLCARTKEIMARMRRMSPADKKTPRFRYTKKKRNQRATYDAMTA